MTPPVSCILTPREAQAVSDKNETDGGYSYIHDNLCPTLTPKTFADYQSQLSSIISSKPSAIAYLWRNNKAEIVAPKSTPDLGDCSQSGNPVRCEALSSANNLSKASVEEEIKAGQKPSCNWQQALEDQNKRWDAFYQANKDKIKAEPLPDIFQGMTLTPKDIELIQTLSLVRKFFYEEEKMVGIDNKNMGDLLCDQKFDCNIISTRSLDLLYRSKISSPERVETISLKHHLTLRVNLSNGNFVYFNNGGQDWLPADTYNYDTGSKNPLSSWEVMASKLLETGFALYAKDDLEGAIVEYKKALELVPKYTTAHYNLGSALHAKGDLDGAIVEYKKALELDPKYTTAHNNLGNVLHAKGDLDGAIVEYKKALELDPNLAIAHNNLGSALFKKSLFEFLRDGLSAFASIPFTAQLY